MSAEEEIEKNVATLTEFFGGSVGDTPLKIACAELLLDLTKTSFVSQMTESGESKKAVEILHNARVSVLGRVGDFSQANSDETVKRK